MIWDQLYKSLEFFKVFLAIDLEIDVPVLIFAVVYFDRGEENFILSSMFVVKPYTIYLFDDVLR